MVVTRGCSGKEEEYSQKEEEEEDSLMCYRGERTGKRKARPRREDAEGEKHRYHLNCLLREGVKLEGSGSVFVRKETNRSVSLKKMKESGKIYILGKHRGDLNCI